MYARDLKRILLQRDQFHSNIIPFLLLQFTNKIARARASKPDSLKAYARSIICTDSTNEIAKRTSMHPKGPTRSSFSHHISYTYTYTLLLSVPPRGMYIIALPDTCPISTRSMQYIMHIIPAFPLLCSCFYALRSPNHQIARSHRFQL